MKKFFTLILFCFFFYNTASAEVFYFKGCKINNFVTGDYVVDIENRKINAVLNAMDGNVQKFSDPIKTIEKEKIFSEKIQSGKGDNIYFEYILNSNLQRITKLQYKRQSGDGFDVFKIQTKKVSYCNDVSAGWDVNKIEKNEDKKKKEKILKVQEKMKKEQEGLFECQGSNYEEWTNCKGKYKTELGYLYEGLFREGIIIKGISIYPGGSKYVGNFKNFKPHGYGTFVWTNGDKYFGDFIDGKASGNGTKIWADGKKYMGTFLNDNLDGEGTLFYPKGKKYEGEFIKGKRHGEGTFTYIDGTAYRGTFVKGVEVGMGVCIGVDGSSLPCTAKEETQSNNFSGKDTHKISLASKKWIRISQFETNSKKGKKIIDLLKENFEIEAQNVCAIKGGYKILKKRVEILEIDETPAYGLEAKVQIGIDGVVECN